jgi:NAD-dependent deacetylase
MIRQAAELIKRASFISVLTGAGSSTPSGVPDFRSAGSGLWTRYMPMEVASLTTFRQHPLRFFEWLRPLASHMYSAEPNPAHRSLAKLEKAGFIHSLITQNIDTLHHKAGSTNILEVHGTLNTLSCTSCYHQTTSEGYLEAFIQHGDIPYCPKCKSILKPDVILFEEQLPIKIWHEARKAALKSDLMIVAGSSLIVMPVAKLPSLVVENGGQVIIINQSDTYMDEQAALMIRDDVASAIPAITNEVLNGNE